MSNESYRDPCPHCGCRLLGFTKEDYIKHLRENDETLKARIEEEMVVDTRDCVDATQDDEEGIAPTQFDASGRQYNHCPECGDTTDHKVWVTVGDRGDVSYRKCLDCGHEHVDRYVPDGGPDE